MNRRLANRLLFDNLINRFVDAQAEQKLANEALFDKEYLPITGDEVFIRAAQEILLTKKVVDDLGVS